MDQELARLKTENEKLRAEIRVLRNFAASIKWRVEMALADYGQLDGTDWISTSAREAVDPD